MHGGELGRAGGLRNEVKVESRAGGGGGGGQAAEVQALGPRARLREKLLEDISYTRIYNDPSPAIC